MRVLGRPMPLLVFSGLKKSAVAPAFFRDFDTGNIGKYKYVSTSDKRVSTLAKIAAMLVLYGF